LQAVPFTATFQPQSFKPYERKQSFHLNLAEIINGHDKRTTVMIKNIPNKYT
jgi:hypothetical protein